MGDSSAVTAPVLGHRLGRRVPPSTVRFDDGLAHRLGEIDDAPQPIEPRWLKLSLKHPTPSFLERLRHSDLQLGLRHGLVVDELPEEKGQATGASSASSCQALVAGHEFADIDAAGHELRLCQVPQEARRHRGIARKVTDRAFRRGDTQAADVGDVVLIPKTGFVDSNALYPIGGRLGHDDVVGIDRERKAVDAARRREPCRATGHSSQGSDERSSLGGEWRHHVDTL